MKQLIVRFIVALFTFALGTSATVVSTALSSRQSSSDAKSVSRLSEETAIASIVLNQLAQDSMVATSNYYVSSYNYSDPSTEVMTSLNQTGVHAEPLSQIQYESASYYIQPVFLRVGRITWLSDHEVLVGGSLRDGHWNRDSRAYLFRLEREHGNWRITTAETIS